MSVAQILEEAKSFSVEEIQDLEVALRLQRLQRTGKIASEEEGRLLRVINRPFPNTERFLALTRKWEDHGLSEHEREELIRINSEREAQNVERVEAVLRMSEIRGTDFKTLWRHMIGDVPTPIIPRD